MIKCIRELCCTCCLYAPYCAALHCTHCYCIIIGMLQDYSIGEKGGWKVADVITDNPKPGEEEKGEGEWVEVHNLYFQVCAF